MGYVPLTLFFMVCFISFPANMAKPSSKEALDQWPQTCSGLNYCTEMPVDYPSIKDLTKMYSDMNLRIPTFITRNANITSNFDNDVTCRHFQYYLEHIYMIKDEKNQIRYALHIPGVYEYAVQVEPCSADANEMLEDLEGSIECQQKYTKYPLYVLALDKRSLELATIKEGFPTSCAAVTIEDF